MAGGGGGGGGGVNMCVCVCRRGGGGGLCKPRLALGDVCGARTPAKKRESEAASPVSAGAALTPNKGHWVVK